MMIVLNNNHTPLAWSVRLGGNGLRNYIGTVLAEHRHPHPFVVWGMASDDGTNWDCFQGDYLTNIHQAQKVFAERARKDPGEPLQERNYIKEISNG